MPAVRRAPRGFARAEIAQEMDAGLQFADTPMLVDRTPDVRGHLLDLLQALAPIMPYRMCTEHNRPVMRLAMLKHLLNFAATHNLDFMIAYRAHPDAAAGLQIAVSSAVVRVPPKTHRIRPAEDAAA